MYPKFEQILKIDTIRSDLLKKINNTSRSAKQKMNIKNFVKETEEPFIFEPTYKLDNNAYNIRLTGKTEVVIQGRTRREYLLLDVDKYWEMMRIIPYHLETRLPSYLKGSFVNQMFHYNIIASQLIFEGGHSKMAYFFQNYLLVGDSIAYQFITNALQNEKDNTNMNVVLTCPFVGKFINTGFIKIALQMPFIIWPKFIIASFGEAEFRHSDRSGREKKIIDLLRYMNTLPIKRILIIPPITKMKNKDERIQLRIWLAKTLGSQEFSTKFRYLNFLDKVIDRCPPQSIEDNVPVLLKETILEIKLRLMSVCSHPKT